MITSGVNMHRKKHSITLVIGGGRSGKSTYALNLAQSLGTEAASRVFLATAQAFDDEMKKRIIAHQCERNNSFVTKEEPIAIAQTLRSLPKSTEVVLIDCLTVWLGNLFYHKGIGESEFDEVTEFLKVLEHPPCSLVIVTNETGLGIIPADAESRAYRDCAGRLNQKVAALADRVVMLVAGIPVTIKG